MQIKEIIVVEGKDDTTAIKRAVQADTIETNGSAISEETLKRIQHAQEKRGVIVFTDPDYPGRRIRAIIEERVQGVKHAFYQKPKQLRRMVKAWGLSMQLTMIYGKHYDMSIPLNKMCQMKMILHWKI